MENSFSSALIIFLGICIVIKLVLWIVDLCTYKYHTHYLHDQRCDLRYIFKFEERYRKHKRTHVWEKRISTRYKKEVYPGKMQLREKVDWVQISRKHAKQLENDLIQEKNKNASN